MVEGNSVRFTPNLPDITEPTPVTFTYTITDGNGHEATGKVTVTVLVEALPRAPFARDDFADTVTRTNRQHRRAGQRQRSVGRWAAPPDRRPGVCRRRRRQADHRQPGHVHSTRGLTGTFRCKYTVSNAQGFVADASIIITVTDPKPGNRPPTINDGAMQPSVPIGGTLTFNANLLADDADGNALVFSSVSRPTHGQTNFSSQSGTFTYFTPAAGSADPTPDADNIQVIISDGHDGNVPGTISIKLIAEPPPTPPPPVPPKTHDISLPATTGVSLLFDVVFALRDDNPGDTLTLVAASADPGPGTAQAVNGLINIVPTAAGPLTVNYTVQTRRGCRRATRSKSRSPIVRRRTRRWRWTTR